MGIPRRIRIKFRETLKHPKGPEISFSNFHIPTTAAPFRCLLDLLALRFVFHSLVGQMVSKMLRLSNKMHKNGSLQIMNPRSLSCQDWVSDTPCLFFIQIKLRHGSIGFWFNGKYMGVSKNRGIPKWMVYNGKPY